MLANREPASYRDPSGFVYRQDGKILRQINSSYAPHYDHFIQSGLYENLVQKKLLIPHREIEAMGAPGHSGANNIYRVIEPEFVPFLSYPFEWCFSQLRDAALTTLEIQREAMRSAMTLKDASAWNFQFVRGRPLHIDTLSFKLYQEGQPWVAYRQFCEQLLAPLALMTLCDSRLGSLLQLYPRGIPLDFACRLLPASAWLRPSMLIHLNMHARFGAKKFPDGLPGDGGNNFSKKALLGLIDHLEGAIRNLPYRVPNGFWARYYGTATSQALRTLNSKQALVRQFLEITRPRMLWDIGANTGEISNNACSQETQIIALDLDPDCVELNYRACIAGGNHNTLPLIMDLTNPSPSIGWNNRETKNLIERGPADVVLVLALIHHLAIGQNLPLGHLAEYFSRACRWLIIEFIPKDDPMVSQMLAYRQDIFTQYSRDCFLEIFNARFDIRREARLPGSSRTLYLMRNRNQL